MVLLEYMTSVRVYLRVELYQCFFVPFFPDSLNFISDAATNRRGILLARSMGGPACAGSGPVCKRSKPRATLYEMHPFFYIVPMPTNRRLNG